MIFNISKMVHLLQLANNHGTFTFVNLLLCTSFKDFERSFYNKAQGSFARLLLVQFAGNEELKTDHHTGDYFPYSGFF